MNENCCSATSVPCRISAPRAVCCSKGALCHRDLLAPIRVLLRFLRVFLAFCGVLGASLLIAIPVLAGGSPPDQDSALSFYTVMPGDTLSGIAEHFGTSLHVLMLQNGLSSPAKIYPGQVVVVKRGWDAVVDSRERIALEYGDTLLDISRRSGITWEQLASANRLLQPAALVPGYILAVPRTGRTAFADLSAALTTPVAAALIHKIPLWTVLRLNPNPIVTPEPLVVPASTQNDLSEPLPFPLDSVRISEQPLIRGTTLQIIVKTGSPLVCSLRLLEQQVPCYENNAPSGDAWVYTALMGVSPRLDPGAYTATLNLETETGEPFSIRVPLLVSAGRYDYERIDLPPDRVSLLDPALSQAESRKIAELRTVRTTERLWALPFSMPLPGSVTSYYGSRRSYGYGFTSYHGGTDFRARLGTPVNAPETGTVVLAEPLVVRGNAVILDHGWGVLTGYWHLSRIDVEVGQLVNRGDLIGAVGNTGLSTGPHLHWEMWVNGASVSPLQWANAGDMLDPVE